MTFYIGERYYNYFFVFSQIVLFDPASGTKKMQFSNPGRTETGQFRISINVANVHFSLKSFLTVSNLKHSAF